MNGDHPLGLLRHKFYVKIAYDRGGGLPTLTGTGSLKLGSGYRRGGEVKWQIVAPSERITHCGSVRSDALWPRQRLVSSVY